MSDVFLPHAETVMRACRIGRSRLDSSKRVAVSAALLKFLLEQLIAAQPFDKDYYLARNPDVAQSYSDGNIIDLHEHFITAGYFEGRWASRPPLDEEFYLKTYPDVAEALKSRVVNSAEDHYMIAGAAEGRIPAASLHRVIAEWERLSNDEADQI